MRKAVTGPDGTSAGFDSPDRVFPVSYTCTLDGAPAPAPGRDPTTLDVIPDSASGTLLAVVGRTTSSLAFPLGTVCELSEELVADPDGAPDFSDGSHWTAATFTPSDTVTVGSFTATTDVTLTNYFEASTAPLLGFTVQKRATGPTNGLTESPPPFGVTFVCTLNGGQAVGFDPADPSRVIAPTGEGILTAALNSPATPSPLFAEGTTCTPQEVPRDGSSDFVNDTYQWTGATFTPSPTFTLTPGDPVDIVLTNMFDGPPAPTEEPTLSPGTEGMAATGAAIPLGLLALAVLLAVGGAILVGRRASS